LPWRYNLVVSLEDQPDWERRLAAAEPSDRAEVDLSTYKGLVAPWNDWPHLAERGRSWAKVLARARLEGGRP
jgi:hypothetical protein